MFLPNSPTSSLGFYEKTEISDCDISCQKPFRKTEKKIGQNLKAVKNGQIHSSYKRLLPHF